MFLVGGWVLAPAKACQIACAPVAHSPVLVDAVVVECHGTPIKWRKYAELACNGRKFTVHEGCELNCKAETSYTLKFSQSMCSTIEV